MQKRNIKSQKGERFEYILVTISAIGLIIFYFVGVFWQKDTSDYYWYKAADAEREAREKEKVKDPWMDDEMFWFLLASPDGHTNPALQCVTIMFNKDIDGKCDVWEQYFDEEGRPVQIIKYDEENKIREYVKFDYALEKNVVYRRNVTKKDNVRDQRMEYAKDGSWVLVYKDIGMPQWRFNYRYEFVYDDAGILTGFYCNDFLDNRAASYEYEYTYDQDGVLTERNCFYNGDLVAKCTFDERKATVHLYTEQQLHDNTCYCEWGEWKHSLEDKQPESDNKEEESATMSTLYKPVRDGIKKTEIYTCDWRNHKTFSVQEFDESGNLIEACEYIGANAKDGVLQELRKYEYDTWGNECGYWQYDKNQELRQFFLAEYSIEGNCLRSFDYDAEDGTFWRNFYVYDSRGNITKYLSFEYCDDGYGTEWHENESKEKLLGTLEEQTEDNLQDCEYYFYDEYGNLIREEGCNRETRIPYYNQWEYKYDEKGNLTEEHICSYYENAKERYLSDTYYSYDEQNRVICVTDREYDPWCYEFEEPESVSINKYEYDSFGNLTGEYAYDAEENLYWYCKREFDKSGNKTKQYYWTKEEGISESEIYKYDESGRISYIGTHFENGIPQDITRYEYTDAGKIIMKNRNYLNYDKVAIYDNEERLHYEYTDDKEDATRNKKHILYYDEAGRVLRDHTFNDEDQFAYGESYIYDANGKLIAEYIYKGMKWLNIGALDETHLYAYDANGNLILYKEYDDWHQLQKRIKNTYYE